MSDEVKIPPSSEEAANGKESVSSTPQYGAVVEAFPTIDAGCDSGTGSWQGDGADVRFVAEN